MEKITRTIKVKLYWIEAINLKTGERFKLGTHTLTAKENTTARLIRKVAEQNGLNTKKYSVYIAEITEQSQKYEMDINTFIKYATAI